MKRYLSLNSLFPLLVVFFMLAGKASVAQVETKDFKGVTNQWPNIIKSLTKNNTVDGKT